MSGFPTSTSPTSTDPTSTSSTPYLNCSEWFSVCLLPRVGYFPIDAGPQTSDGSSYLTLLIYGLRGEFCLPPDISFSKYIASSIMAVSVSMVAVGLVALALLGLLRLRHVGKRAPGLPPGPPTVPVLGNLHLVRAFSLCSRQKLNVHARCQPRMHIYSSRNGPKNTGEPMPASLDNVPQLIYQDLSTRWYSVPRPSLSCLRIRL